MSATIIKVIRPNGEVTSFKELTNSHGFAPVIWSVLCSKYFGAPGAWMIGDQGANNLDELVYRPDMPEHWRTTLKLTWHRMIVPKKDLTETANRVEQFIKDFEFDLRGSHNHLFTVAYNMILCNGWNNIEGVCFRVTTVCSDPWVISNSQDGSERPYNVNVDTGHFFIMDELKRLEEV